MPKITLPSQTLIRLGVFHEETEIHYKGELTLTMQTRIRVTTMKDEDPIEQAEVKAVCSPSDCFSKQAGRYIAARRILATDLVKKFTKEDREMLMRKICPELFRSKDEIDRRTYQRLAKRFEKKEEKPKVVQG